MSSSLRACSTGFKSQMHSNSLHCEHRDRHLYTTVPQILYLRPSGVPKLRTRDDVILQIRQLELNLQGCVYEPPTFSSIFSPSTITRMAMRDADAVPLILNPPPPPPGPTQRRKTNSQARFVEDLDDGRATRVVDSQSAPHRKMSYTSPSRMRNDCGYPRTRTSRYYGGRSGRTLHADNTSSEDTDFDP